MKKLALPFFHSDGRPLLLHAVLKTCFALAFFLTVSFAAQAQTLLPTAQIYDDYSIELDIDEPLTTIYQADVSHYASNMNDQASAESFMAQFERPYANLTVDFATLTTTVNLQTNAITASWTVEDWNEYLKTN